LLDSYEQERLPVARRLLNTTDRAFRLIVSDSWFAGLLRTQVLARIAAFAMGRERIQRIAFRTVSQTGIHYRSSALSQSLPDLPDSAPQAGDRFPWLKLRLQPGGPLEDLFQKVDDTRFTLVLFGASLPADGSLHFGDLVRIHVIPVDAVNEAELARTSIPRPAFYLIRPDGYVGLCGGRLDSAAMERYITARLGLERGVPSEGSTPVPLAARTP
jgi:hypothetical protein